MQETNLIKQLQQDLTVYGKIALIPGDFVADAMFARTSGHLTDTASADTKQERALLILSSAEIPGRYKNVECRQITEKEERELTDLYYTYEFSDRFCLLDCPAQYGGLFNYVETGMLSGDEAISCMLSIR